MADSRRWSRQKPPAGVVRADKAEPKVPVVERPARAERGRSRPPASAPRHRKPRPLRLPPRFSPRPPAAAPDQAPLLYPVQGAPSELLLAPTASCNQTLVFLSVWTPIWYPLAPWGPWAPTLLVPGIYRSIVSLRVELPTPLHAAGLTPAVQALCYPRNDNQPGGECVCPYCIK